MLLLSLLTLVVLQGVGVLSLSFFGTDFRSFDCAIQYCDLGGTIWSPMLMLYNLCGNSKDACGTAVAHEGLMTRAEKGFHLC